MQRMQPCLRYCACKAQNFSAQFLRLHLLLYPSSPLLRSFQGNFLCCIYTIVYFIPSPGAFLGKIKYHKIAFSFVIEYFNPSCEIFSGKVFEVRFRLKIFIVCTLSPLQRSFLGKTFESETFLLGCYCILHIPQLGVLTEI